MKFGGRVIWNAQKAAEHGRVGSGICGTVGYQARESSLNGI